MIHFESLIVFHCKPNASSTSSASHILKPIKKALFSFQPATCTRQLFIFSNLAESELILLQKQVQNSISQLDTCELIMGFDAYTFLLRWMTGLLSTKYQQNDRFVLGQVRKCWTEFCLTADEQLKGSALRRIIPALLGDARLIRNKIENQLSDLSNEPRIKIVEDICTQYRSLREMNISPYSCRSPYFLAQNSAPLSRESIKVEIQRLSKKLIKLQAEISIIGDRVNLNAEPSHPEQKAMFAKTQASLSATWEKKKLEVCLQQLITKDELQELSPIGLESVPIITSFSSIKSGY
jgi:hypothetical protein